MIVPTPDDGFTFAYRIRFSYGSGHVFTSEPERHVRILDVDAIRAFNGAFEAAVTTRLARFGWGELGDYDDGGNAGESIDVKAGLADDELAMATGMATYYLQRAIGQLVEGATPDPSVCAYLESENVEVALIPDSTEWLAEKAALPAAVVRHVPYEHEARRGGLCPRRGWATYGPEVRWRYAIRGWARVQLGARDPGRSSTGHLFARVRRPGARSIRGDETVRQRERYPRRLSRGLKAESNMTMTVITEKRHDRDRIGHISWRPHDRERQDHQHRGTPRGDGRNRECDAGDDGGHRRDRPVRDPRQHRLPHAHGDAVRRHDRER